MQKGRGGIGDEYLFPLPQARFEGDRGVKKQRVCGSCCDRLQIAIGVYADNLALYVHRHVEVVMIIEGRSVQAL